MTPVTIVDAPAALSDAQRRALRRAAAMMIPASPVFGVPGADDERIFADIVRSLGRDADAVRQALARLDDLAGSPFADCDVAAAQAAAAGLRDGEPAIVAPLVAAVVRCYYRDDRVMESLGLEPRPPFPKGYEVEQGDWSLLDPVRARGPIWRAAG